MAVKHFLHSLAERPQPSGVLSEEKLLEITNERKAYTMEEFKEYCESFYKPN